MTEDEAKQKWCPMVRLRGKRYWNNRGSIPAVYKDRHHTLCIASACMAWRLKEPLTVHEIEYYGGKAQGYCGLAGKIERVGVNG